MRVLFFASAFLLLATAGAWADEVAKDAPASSQVGPMTHGIAPTAAEVAAAAKAAHTVRKTAPAALSEAEMLRMQRDSQARAVLDLQLELAKARAELESMKAVAAEKSPVP